MRALWDAVRDPSKEVERAVNRLFDGLLIVGSLAVAALFVAVSVAEKGPGPAHGVGVAFAAAVLWVTFYVLDRSDTVGSRWDRVVVFFRYWTMTGLLFGGGITLAEIVARAAPSTPVGYITEVTVGIALLAALARTVGRRQSLARDVARLLKRADARRHLLDDDDWALLQEQLAAAWLWRSGASFMAPDVAERWCHNARYHTTSVGDPNGIKQIRHWVTRIAGEGTR